MTDETRLLLIADTHIPPRARAMPAQVWDEVERADVVVHAEDDEPSAPVARLLHDPAVAIVVGLLLLAAALGAGAERATGVPAERATDAEGFTAALERALAIPGPALVEAMLPPTL